MIIMPRRIANEHPVLLPTAPTITMEGEYSFVARRPDGRVRRRLDNVRNLITNSGLDAVASSVAGAFIGTIQVGSGTAAPAATDTSLGNLVASTSTAQVAPASTYDSANRRMVSIGTWRFAEGTAAGNLTEVGARTQKTGTALISRALITDGTGTPIAFTVASDEILDVTYTLYQNIPQDATGTFNVTIDGTVTPFDYIMRPAGVGNSTMWGVSFGATGHLYRQHLTGQENSSGGLGTADITADISGYNQNQGMGWQSVTAMAAYTSGTYTQDYTWTRPVGVTGTVKSLWVNCTSASFQMSFTPTWAITSTKKFTFNMRMSWGRA